MTWARRRRQAAARPAQGCPATVNHTVRYCPCPSPSPSTTHHTPLPYPLPITLFRRPPFPLPLPAVPHLVDGGFQHVLSHVQPPHERSECSAGLLLLGGRRRGPLGVAPGQQVAADVGVAEVDLQGSEQRERERPDERALCTSLPQSRSESRSEPRSEPDPS